jgi:hypothetical protein
MKKLTFVAVFLSLGMFITGCGGSGGNTEPGATNTGAGNGAGGEVEDPDAGVGTDPALMDPNQKNP